MNTDEKTSKSRVEQAAETLRAWRLLLAELVAIAGLVAGLVS